LNIAAWVVDEASNNETIKILFIIDFLLDLIMKVCRINENGQLARGAVLVLRSAGPNG
jgi:hypothetical protein